MPTYLLLLLALAASLPAQQKVKNDEIAGVVASANGPEAGVWVIAETTDLPTRYSKEVVTDDHGRYLIPQLPAATYTVWARGYGLVDSPKIQTKPGKQINLSPSVAPDKKSAARYYPANYWYSMLTIPENSEFPGTGPSGNGISPTIKSQQQWLHLIKTDSCESCHQLGNEYTRTIPGAVPKSRFAGPSLDAPRAIGPSWPGDGRRAHATWCGKSHHAIGRLDHPYRAWRVACSKRRPDRKESNAASSSRNGIGPIPRLICMTKFPATSAIRALTRMA